MSKNFTNLTKFDEKWPTRLNFSALFCEYNFLSALSTNVILSWKPLSAPSSFPNEFNSGPESVREFEILPIMKISVSKIRSRIMYFQDIALQNLCKIGQI